MVLGDDTYANRSLDSSYGSGRAATFPATVYVAQFNGAPGQGGVECSGGGYARVAVTNNDGNFPPATGRQKSNGTDVVFPTSTGTWTPATTDYWAFMDAATGGLVIDYAALQDPLSIDQAGLTPRYAPGALVVSA